MKFRYCSVVWHERGVLTTFYDGTETLAWPHSEDPHYSVIAHRCGYRDDLLTYCREHDFVHSFLADRLHGAVSRVLWTQTHEREPLLTYDVVEALVQTFQAFLNANIEPILAGVEWDWLRQEARELLR